MYWWRIILSELKIIGLAEGRGADVLCSNWWLFYLVHACTNYLQQESWSKDAKLQQCRFQVGEPVDNAWFENGARCFYGQCILTLICDFCVIYNLNHCWVTKEALEHICIPLNPNNGNLCWAKAEIFHGLLQPYCKTLCLTYYSWWLELRNWILLYWIILHILELKPLYTLS